MILVSKLCTDPPGEILVVLDTVGKSLGHLQLGNLFNVHQARVSPAGKRLAFVLLNGKEDKRGFYNPEDVYLVDLPLAKPPKEPTFRDLLDPETVARTGSFPRKRSVFQHPARDLRESRIVTKCVPLGELSHSRDKNRD